MNLVGDFHVHTVASGDAFSTIEELSKKGKEIGLEVIAITDHGPAMAASSHRYYFDSLSNNIKEANGIRILPGVEANIIEENGSLDLPEKTIEKLSFTIISFHTFSWKEDDIKSNTRALINCINKYPNIKAIAHLNKPYFDLDMTEIIPHLIKKSIAIELNSRALESDRKNWGNYRRIISNMESLGVKFIISSDAHSLQQLGDFNSAIEFAKYCGLREENIVNTSIDKLKNYLCLDL